VRYAGGLAAQQDAIRAQVERSTHGQPNWSAWKPITGNRPPSSTPCWRATPSAPLAEPSALRPLPARLDGPAERAPAGERNPQLAIEAARIDGAGKSRDLAYRNRFPDFIVGVQPMQVGDRVDAWTLMLE
jgi:cobalt-zinc-cadmium efflux system outer membrane protein